MNEYQLVYLSSFHEDLRNTVLYIAYVLHNPEAAEKLINEIEKSIKTRLKAPESFQKYISVHHRLYAYYRIKVGNYSVYYVTYQTRTGKVMEVRRLMNDLQNSALI